MTPLDDATYSRDTTDMPKRHESGKRKKATGAKAAGAFAGLMGRKVLGALGRKPSKGMLGKEPSKRASSRPLKKTRRIKRTGGKR